MTSTGVASTIVHRLAFADAADRPAAGPAARLDFDSTLAFPDLPYDSAAPAARYAESARPAVSAVVDAAYRALARVPTAAAFVAAQLGTVVLRTSTTPAASSSNRTHVGVVVLTNIDAQADAELVCAEALLHESVHQFLYRVEQQHGPICDLDATRRYRSPWSGNRIPLHSFVHACFVYQALLAFWSRYAAAGDEGDRDGAAFARDRVARSLFGYGFVGAVIDDPTFPRAAVDPAILAAIGAVATAIDEPDDDEPFAATRHGPWLQRIVAGLATLDRRIVADEAA